jgi:uncharacterized membrane protein
MMCPTFHKNLPLFSMTSNHLRLALLSGICAALASVCAKLASSASENYTRLLWTAAVIGSNALMWLLFTTALSKAPSSIQVTTVNTSANLATTGIVGLMLFNENLSIQWWIGSIFITVGSLLMNLNEHKKSD